MSCHIRVEPSIVLLTINGPLWAKVSAESGVFLLVKSHGHVVCVLLVFLDLSVEVFELSFLSSAAVDVDCQ